MKRYVAAMIRDAKTEEGLTEDNFKVVFLNEYDIHVIHSFIIHSCYVIYHHVCIFFFCILVIFNLFFHYCNALTVNANPLRTCLEVIRQTNNSHLLTK